MTKNSPFRSAIGLVLALALVAAACGSSGDAGTTTTASPAATTTTTSGSAATTTTAPSTDTTAPPGPTTTTTTLPGEPIDLYAQPGDVLGVVAVAYNDVLNLRAGPGTDFDPPILQLPGTKDNLIATGQNRLLTDSIWYQVTVDGVPGWVSARFVAYLGAVDDTTSQIETQFGATPVADTMENLGLLIANLVASEEPPSRIRMTVAPSSGDLSEVTYDVVGLGDDSLFGLRLHIFAEETDTGTFSLKTVEQTSLCGRGVTPEGLCV